MLCFCVLYDADVRAKFLVVNEFVIFLCFHILVFVFVNINYTSLMKRQYDVNVWT